MFLEALFIIARTENQPRCFSLGEYMNKQWKNQALNYELALRRNGLSSQEEDFIVEWLREVHLSEKSVYSITHGYSGIEKENLKDSKDK